MLNQSLITKVNSKHNWIYWIGGTQVGITVLSILLSLAFFIVMIVIYGAQPLAALTALFQGALKGKSSIVSTLQEATMLILTGLAVLLPYKTGYFNIGGQGQLEIGGLAAVIVATKMSGPPFIIILVAMVAAITAGLLVALIPLILKIKINASEVTTAIMMNFICTNLISALITGVLKDPKAFYGTTRVIPEANWLPLLPEFVGINIGVWVALATPLIIFWWMKRTIYGIQLEAVGFNCRAAETAGISVNNVLITAVFAGAAMAGLAGGIQVLGVYHRVAQGWAMPWGFIGIVIAFLGGNALGVIPVALLMSILVTGARYMQAMTGIPEALVSLMQGVAVLIFIALNTLRSLNLVKQKTRLLKAV